MTVSLNQLRTMLRDLAASVALDNEQLEAVYAHLQGLFESFGIAALSATKPIVRWAVGLFANTTGAPNQVTQIGHNVGINCAGRDDPTKHGAWMTVEHEFEITPSGPRLVEFHWQYFSVAGTSRRPVTATVNIVTDVCSVALTGLTTFTSSAGAQRMTVEEDGLVRLQANGASAFFYKVGNDTPILAGDRTAASAVEILRVDSGNFIRFDIGQNYAGVFMTTPIVNLAPGAVSKLQVNTTGVGFHASAPIAKPSIAGSRGGNAALASLLTALANYGLITDNTTA